MSSRSRNWSLWPAPDDGDAVIGVVHLVWAPLGVDPLRTFLRSYHAHEAGVSHELIILLNGLDVVDRQARDATREALLAELRGTEHRVMELERAALDLSAYGESAHRLQHDRLCFLNSYCAILGENWLTYLSRALDEPDVGLVGASASWESQAEWVRGKHRYWLYQLANVRHARRDFPRFPNPHIRTSAFMLERARTLEMGMEDTHDKHSTYLLESGWASITRQVEDRGLRAVVVGLHGRTYDIPEWPSSNTFRSGEQESLLIADNQTRDYQSSSARRRRRLSRDSWGYRGGSVGSS